MLYTRILIHNYTLRQHCYASEIPKIHLQLYITPTSHISQALPPVTLGSKVIGGAAAAPIGDQLWTQIFTTLICEWNIHDEILSLANNY